MLLTLFLLLSAITLFLLFSIFLVRYPAVVILLLGGLVMVRASGLPDPRLAQVAGATVYAADALFAAAALAAGLRLARKGPRSLPLHRLGCGLLLLSVSLAVARGLMLFDLQQVFNEFRSFFYFLAGLAFAVVLFADRLPPRRAGVMLAGLSLFLAALAVVRLGAGGAGTSQGRILSTGEYVDARAVDAATALLIAQGLWLVLLMTSKRVAPIKTQLSLALAALVVVLQHRSVWAATASGVAATFMASPVLRRAVVKRLALIVGLFALLGVVLVAGELRSVGEGVAASAQDVLKERNTLTARVDGWRLLLGDSRLLTPEGLLVGLPMGSGYYRTVAGQVATYSPHNFYIQLLLRGGLVALVGLAMIVAGSLRNYDSHRTEAVAALGIIVSTGVFFMAYGPAHEQGIFLGVALKLLSRSVAGPPRHVPEVLGKRLTGVHA